MVERGWVEARGEGKGRTCTAQHLFIASWNLEQDTLEFAVSNRFSRNR
jgi:hypothetical protein